MPSKSPISEFGLYLRGKRLSAGLSLRDVADAMDPPISHVALAEVERGVRAGLKRERWDELERVIPGFSAAEAESLSVKDRPIQLSLKDAPPQYQSLGLALARRIDRRDLKANELDEIMRILGQKGVDDA